MLNIKLKQKYIYIIFGIILFDQGSKYLIKHFFNPYDYSNAVDVIKGFFKIIYVRNSGAVWGIFSNHPNTIVPIIITGLSIIALGIVIFYFLRLDIKCSLELTSFAFIIGGATGNIIDRILQGYVVDFLDVYIKNSHWPTFNVADSFITIGVIILVISIARGKCPSLN
jgi:signal peptidase II